MSKAVLSNRIYFKASTALISSLSKQLTYKIKTGQGRYEKIEIVRNYKIIDKETIAIPQGRIDLVPKDYEILDKRSIVPVDWPAPLLPLNSEQELIYTQVEDTCFINALVGWGKTFASLYIAAKLGQKTLVIVHTSMLRDQWVKEVKKLFGIEAGIIGGGIKDYKDSIIVIANIQTMSKIADSLAGEFGTVILDEAHHVPAETFTNTLDLLKARYRIALSGTMQRKDGKHILFKDFFGFIVHKPPQNNTINPKVLIVKTGIKLIPGIHYAKKINFLLEDEDYINFIVNFAKIQIAKGHKTIIISERVKFLRRVQELLGPKCILMIGPTAYESERKRMEVGLESGELDAVAGSRGIFSEGISVNILSCMILTTPLSSIPTLEQLAGRIMRLHPRKPQPILVDMNFAGLNEKRQNNVRLGFYIQKGWDIETV